MYFAESRKLMADSGNPKARVPIGEGGNPSPLGEEKFIIRRYVMSQVWSPYEDGFESSPDLDSQILQARAGGTGGDTS